MRMVLVIASMVLASGANATTLFGSNDSHDCHASGRDSSACNTTTNNTTTYDIDFNKTIDLSDNSVDNSVNNSASAVSGPSTAISGPSVSNAVTGPSTSSSTGGNASVGGVGNGLGNFSPSSSLDVERGAFDVDVNGGDVDVDNYNTDVNHVSNDTDVDNRDYTNVDASSTNFNTLKDGDTDVDNNTFVGGDKTVQGQYVEGDTVNIGGGEPLAAQSLELEGDSVNVEGDTYINEAARIPVNSAPASFSDICSSGMAGGDATISISLAVTNDVCQMLMMADAFMAIGDVEKAHAFVQRAANHARVKGSMGMFRHIVTLGIL